MEMTTGLKKRKLSSTSLETTSRGERLVAQEQEEGHHRGAKMEEGVFQEEFLDLLVVSEMETDCQEDKVEGLCWELHQSLLCRLHLRQPQFFAVGLSQGGLPNVR